MIAANRFSSDNNPDDDQNSDALPGLADLSKLARRTVFICRNASPYTTGNIVEVLEILPTLNQAHAYAQGYNAAAKEAGDGFAFVGTCELKCALVRHLSKQSGDVT